MAKSKQQPEPRRERLSQSEMPSYTLEEAVGIAQALVDNFAGRSAPPHDVAFALGTSPTSSAWKMMSGAAAAYGLTAGAYNAQEIVLSDLGRQVVAGDRKAILQAVLTPRISNEIFRRYDRQKFPKPEIASKIMPALGLPLERVEKYYAILKANGIFAGILRAQGAGFFVALDGAPQVTSASGSVDATGDVSEDDVVVPFATNTAANDPAPPVGLTPPEPAKLKKLFVAHGKNHQALEDLKKILLELKIPFTVAIDEPHSGRPISAKVAGLMNECSAGIFVFTRDEQFFKKAADGSMEEVWRSSENVVFELGAAGKLWDRKIIIIKEKGVTLATDFKDLGYIEFDPGMLSSKVMDIFKELISMKLIKLSAA